MNKRIVYYLLIFLGTGCFSFSYAQGVSVKASIDRNKILIGEPIQVILDASIPRDAGIKWFNLDSISHFEYIEKGSIDSSITSTRINCHQKITITSFDSGRWVLPAFSLEWNGRSYITDSFPVSVAFSNFDPRQDYHDIKDILDVENPAVKYINWAIAALSLLSMIGLVYFLRKSKLAARTLIAGNAQANAYDEAMLALQELKKRNLPEQGEVKLYYTLITDIIRKFIARKTGLPTMEKTSSELILLVKDKNIPHESVLPLAQAFRLGDAVKFAKYIPAAADNEETMNIAHSSIQFINNIDNSVV